VSETNDLRGQRRFDLTVAAVVAYLLAAFLVTALLRSWPDLGCVRPGVDIALKSEDAKRKLNS